MRLINRRIATKIWEGKAEFLPFFIEEWDGSHEIVRVCPADVIGDGVVDWRPRTITDQDTVVMVYPDGVGQPVSAAYFWSLVR